jgi:GcrA cell cycle regulator
MSTFGHRLAELHPGAKAKAESPWTDELIQRLRVDWAAGITASEIAGRFGLSKNAIVGKAHRLFLDSRPTPIKRDPNKPLPVRKPAKPFMPAFRLPALASDIGTPAPIPVMPFRLTPPAAVETVFLPRKAGTRQCAWVDEGPRPMTWIYCQDSTDGGGSYCTEHHRISYQPRRAGV